MTMTMTISITKKYVYKDVRNVRGKVPNISVTFTIEDLEQGTKNGIPASKENLKIANIVKRKMAEVRRAFPAIDKFGMVCVEVK